MNKDLLEIKRNLDAIIYDVEQLDTVDTLTINNTRILLQKMIEYREKKGK